MAKKVRWTTRAIIDRSKIYRYWLKRNQSNIYSEKLEDLFEKLAETISNFPHIGTQTSYREVYTKIISNYKIFYRINADEIQILRVCDTRQNPAKAGI